MAHSLTPLRAWGQVEETMGPDSFFTRIPPSLWPDLLPLLKPMSFDPLDGKVWPTHSRCLVTAWS